MRPRTIAAGFVLCLAASAFAQAPVEAQVDLAGLVPESAIKVVSAASGVTVSWPAGNGATATLNIATGERPMLSASIDGATVFQNAFLAYTMRIGQRDLKPAGWIHFFDRVDERPFQTLPLEFSATTVKAVSTATRATVTVGPAKCGSFTGDLQLTFFAGSPLVQVEAVMTTQEEARAILYDPSLELHREQVKRVAFETYDGKLTTAAPDAIKTGAVRAHLRTLVAHTGGGAVAVFPPPHQFFYPLDYATNFGFNEVTRTDDAIRIGMRQPPRGDSRFRPWVNAPGGTAQRLCMFLQLSNGDSKKAIDEVRSLTRNDQVPEVAGYKAMVSHLHVEHTDEFLRQRGFGTDLAAIPWGLEEPGWLQLFKARGIQIAHLAEFHFGDTPKRDARRRVEELKALHSECDRLSDDTFLMLPGEEPNVHLGGHWISFFPKPVYWVLNRGKDEPFVEQKDGITLYRVGNAADVLELFKRENGLMWTAHPRIKGSQNFPDVYMGSDYFKSPHFVGGAWKAMPADYSRDRLGERVLNLGDDIANKGFRKPILGEIDLFQMDPTSELYGHLNVNYVQIDKLPKFSEGWKPILDCFRNGKFFTTTGEVLIENTKLAGVTPGDETPPVAETTVTAKLTFTFPPAFAEVVSGDGEKTYRDRVDLSSWPAFVAKEVSIPVNLKGRKWARLEAWDVARNGAFTPAVWLGQ